MGYIREGITKHWYDIPFPTFLNITPDDDYFKEKTLPRINLMEKPYVILKQHATNGSAGFKKHYFSDERRPT